MPTYEYKCDECGYRFEKFQRMTEARLTECPECQGAVRRLIGAGAGIIFKGSGFYCTDYRKPCDAARAAEAAAIGKPDTNPVAKP
jgi:putative FmdB family regulatory protein